ncbi:8135_t:CDS:2, partial [Entrophospora sp. SA101]
YPYPNESKVSPGTGLVGSRVNEKIQKKMEKPNYEIVLLTSTKIIIPSILVTDLKKIRNAISNLYEHDVDNLLKTISLSVDREKLSKDHFLANGILYYENLKENNSIIYDSLDLDKKIIDAAEKKFISSFLENSETATCDIYENVKFTKLYKQTNINENT